MNYGEAVLITLTGFGYVLIGVVAVALFIFCIYLTFAAEDSYGNRIRHPWWVRTLGALYLVASVIFGIAFLIWSVQS